MIFVGAIIITVTSNSYSRVHVDGSLGIIAQQAFDFSPRKFIIPVVNSIIFEQIWHESRGMLRNAAERGMGEDGKNAARVTTTLRKKQKAQLEALADKQGVALSWLIRQLIERYLEEPTDIRPPWVKEERPS